MTREYFGFDFDAHVTSALPASSGESARDGRVAAVRLDDNGRIVAATADAAALLGYAQEDLKGRRLADLAAKGWRAAAEGVTARIVGGTLESCELLLCGRSGRRVLVRMAARSIDGDGACEHVVAWTEVQSPRGPAKVPDAEERRLRKLALDLLSTQEAERRRLAGELLGGLAPLVIMAKFMVEEALQRLLRGANKEAADVLTNVTGRLRDVIGELRRISTELRPSLLDDLGLLPTIEWFCRQCEQACRTLRVERVIEVDEADVPDPLKLEIFRIIEEAVSNAVQHANATTVRVSLRKRGGELELRITDDGLGFDAAQLFYGNARLLGIGLQTIRRRVEGTQGRMMLESAPLRGTVVGANWKLDQHVGVAA